jgi:serine/threonine protein kinase
MLAGYPPFNGRSENEIFKRILSGKFAFHNEEWKSISPSVKELITSMLTLDPALRPSAKEVLNHPWM